MDVVKRFDEMAFPIDAMIEDYAWRGGSRAPMRWCDKYAAEKQAMFTELEKRQVRLGLHLNQSLPGNGS